MKRRLVLLLLLLVGGAIANVAVAWGCAANKWWLSFGPPGAIVESDRLWLAAFEPDLDEDRIEVRRQSRFGWAETVYFIPVSDSGERRYWVVTSGWPVMALRKHSGSQFERMVARERTEITRGGQPSSIEYFPEFAAVHIPALSAGMLPAKAIWPGFAINTVFYAVVLWLLFAGPFVLRRRRRIRRGLCPKCAYDLRGTPSDATACPECGAAVAKMERTCDH